VSHSAHSHVPANDTPKSQNHQNIVNKHTKPDESNDSNNVNRQNGKAERRNIVTKQANAKKNLTIQNNVNRQQRQSRKTKHRHQTG
jgi:hypothetical protein